MSDQSSAAAFNLQLFALDVAPCPAAAAASARCTLAFTFLDYPTVLLHATEHHPLPHQRRRDAGALRFGGGKCCIIHTDDGDELAHLAGQVGGVQQQMAGAGERMRMMGRFCCMHRHA